MQVITAAFAKMNNLSSSDFQMFLYLPVIWPLAPDCSLSWPDCSTINCTLCSGVALLHGEHDDEFQAARLQFHLILSL